MTKYIKEWDPVDEMYVIWTDDDKLIGSVWYSNDADKIVDLLNEYDEDMNKFRTLYRLAMGV